MTVIQTYKWLIAYTENKEKTFKKNLIVQQQEICEHLVPFFTHSTAYDIHIHLLNHGLFVPDPLDKEVIDEMINKQFWTAMKHDFKKLKKHWDGPEIPIFLFPSDYTNKLLREEFNSRSGLSYPDKIFLFLTDKSTRKEMQSLLTHEYNHVVRLAVMNKKGEDLELLDTLVMEGLAENAVKELVGEKQLTNWTKLYGLSTAQKHWNKWIKPNITMKKNTKAHEQIMYGGGTIPKWLGYNVGYHLVTSFINNSSTPIHDVLRLASKEILEGSDFD